MIPRESFRPFDPGKVALPPAAATRHSRCKPRQERLHDSPVPAPEPDGTAPPRSSNRRASCSYILSRWNGGRNLKRGRSEVPAAMERRNRSPRESPVLKDDCFPPTNIKPEGTTTSRAYPFRRCPAFANRRTRRIWQSLLDRSPASTLPALAATNCAASDTPYEAPRS
jgi:hypothetical protein